MTLKDQIAADTRAVFLNEDDFAVTVTRLIGGDANDAVEISAIVDWDGEQGRNEFSGEGATTEDPAGRSLRRNCRLDVALADLEPPLRPQYDKFVLPDGMIVILQRIESHDDWMATLLCFAREDETTHRPRLRPL